MRYARLRMAVCSLLVALAAHRTARAGPSIANPRHANEHFDIPDSSHVERSEFGILFGTPAGFNLEAGYWPHPKWGLRASGLYWGAGLAGFQGNLCYTIGRRARRREALALVAGSLASNGETWSYGGVAFDWNVAPLYLEAGIVLGSGKLKVFANDGPNAALIVQLGLMGGGGVLGPR